jgi:hypothetical protein
MVWRKWLLALYAPAWLQQLIASHGRQSRDGVSMLTSNHCGCCHWWKYRSICCRFALDPMFTVGIIFRGRTVRTNASSSAYLHSVLFAGPTCRTCAAHTHIQLAKPNKPPSRQDRLGMTLDL